MKPNVVKSGSRNQIRLSDREKATPRPPTTTKVVLPVDVDDLFELSSEKYQETMSCWNCRNALKLESKRFEWPIGPYLMYFPAVPGYFCDLCGENYFPEGVLERLSESAEKALEERPPQPPYVNPERLQSKLG